MVKIQAFNRSYSQAVEQGGNETLVDRNRRIPNQKNRVDEQTEAAVVAYTLEKKMAEKNLILSESQVQA
jgi:hypothetical protein